MYICTIPLAPFTQKQYSFPYYYFAVTTAIGIGTVLCVCLPIPELWVLLCPLSPSKVGDVCTHTITQRASTRTLRQQSLPGRG